MKALYFYPTALLVLLTTFSCEKKLETKSEITLDKKTDTTNAVENQTKIQKTDYQKTVSYKDITFDVSASGNTLTILPKGFQVDNTKVTKTIDGTVTNVEVGDINADDSPELMIYITSVGSGSYGTAIGFSGNANKSMSEITVPSIADNPKANKGYMGHDEFAIVEGILAQRFPIYKKEDSNSKPTGGTRQIQYKLKNGEASRIFVIDKIIEF